MKRRTLYTGPRCEYPVKRPNARGNARDFCELPATRSRPGSGRAGNCFWFCTDHAEQYDAEQKEREKAGPELTPPAADETESRIRAKWEAEQAKLPPGKRKTWEQACAEEEQDMGRKLRASRKRGGP
ncbi:MAG: hypothetical protein QM820_58580 [Minicystis sp.]